jgi:hypothetical protein
MHGESEHPNVYRLKSYGFKDKGSEFRGTWPAIPALVSLVSFSLQPAMCIQVGHH